MNMRLSAHESWQKRTRAISGRRGFKGVDDVIEIHFLVDRNDVPDLHMLSETG